MGSEYGQFSFEQNTLQQRRIDKGKLAMNSAMERGSLTEALRETLALFEEGGAPQTTTEVADRLDLGRRSTYERLERLVDERSTRYQESRWKRTRVVASTQRTRPH